MKKCSVCKMELNEENSYKKGNRLQNLCKDCFNKMCSKRWIKIKLKAIEHKGGKCKNCGYNKYYGALEFHHIDPTKKDFVWTKLRLKSWDKIILELEKCDLLCSNCHREIHKK